MITKEERKNRVVLFLTNENKKKKPKAIKNLLTGKVDQDIPLKS